MRRLRSLALAGLLVATSCTTYTQILWCEPDTIDIDHGGHGEILLRAETWAQDLFGRIERSEVRIGSADTSGTSGAVAIAFLSGTSPDSLSGRGSVLVTSRWVDGPTRIERVPSVIDASVDTGYGGSGFAAATCFATIRHTEPAGAESSGSSPSPPATTPPAVSTPPAVVSTPPAVAVSPSLPPERFQTSPPPVETSTPTPTPTGLFSPCPTFVGAITTPPAAPDTTSPAGIVTAATVLNTCPPTPTPTPTPRPTPTPTPTAQLTFEHTQPGVQSEVYLTLTGTPGAAVIATLTGPAVKIAATQIGTMDASGELRLTWVITQLGTYRASGTIGGAPLTAQVEVR